MSFNLNPNQIEIEDINGLQEDLNILNSTYLDLFDQTNNLVGSIPESSKPLALDLKKHTIAYLRGGNPTRMWEMPNFDFTKRSLPSSPTKYSGVMNVLGYGIIASSLDLEKIVAVLIDGGASYTSYLVVLDKEGNTLQTFTMSGRYYYLHYHDGVIVAGEMFGGYNSSDTTTITKFFLNSSMTLVDSVSDSEIPMNQMSELTYFKGNWIIKRGQSSQFIYSSDLITWTFGNLPIYYSYSGQYTKFCNDGNRVFMYYNTGGSTYGELGPENIIFSDDGINWVGPIRVGTNPNCYPRTISFLPNKIVVNITNDNNLWRQSIDGGYTWTSFQTVFTNNSYPWIQDIFTIIKHDEIYYGLNGLSVATSTDLINWNYIYQTPLGSWENNMMFNDYVPYFGMIVYTDNSSKTFSQILGVQ